VIVAVTSSGGKHKAKDVTPTDDTQVVLPTGPENQAPGTPKVTGTRRPDGKVRFQWTYDARAAGDSYRWRESGSATDTGTATHPNLVVTAPAGHEVCLQVQVFRSSGSFASSWSDPKCAG